MHLLKTLTLLVCSATLATAAIAQEEPGENADSASTRHSRHMRMPMNGGRHSDDMTPTPVRRWYTGNTFDGAIFSTAVFEKPGRRRELTTLRFSMINVGYHFNYDFDEHFGFFTGLGIKNIGFIEKDGDSTIKRRVYTLGIPLGFKLGNLAKKHYGFIGGGFDAPFNYREKGFVKRSDKQKFNEWFSSRTPDFMPYLFAGFSFGAGQTFKVQYYPGNFFDPEYQREDNGVITHPYRGYTAHLLYISLGFDLHSKPHDKKQAEDTPPPAEM